MIPEKQVHGEVMGAPTYLLAGQVCDLEGLRTEAEAELKEPDRWGTTFTLLRSWGRQAARPVLHGTARPAKSRIRKAKRNERRS